MGLFEIIKDPKYYYASKVSSEYNHLTDLGKEALIEYVSGMAPYMLQQELREFEEKVKQKVWEDLKK